jgi:methyltransferase (TIGR00027 family)
MNFAAAPSRTSQAVALIRAALDRPCSDQGDASAQSKLCAGMGGELPPWLWPSIEARTRFVDGQVLAAISAGVSQIVVCGAGYDDRGLRFRTPGVGFFELDHADTQADKARRLRAIGAGQAITLAATDFRDDDVAEVLANCGHLTGQQSLFVCEGLLIYLDQQTCERLLAGLASRAAPGSRLAVSLSTHADGLVSAEVVATANARRRTAAAEPWRTILPAAEHLALLEHAGWTVRCSHESPAAGATASHGRRSLLVSAVASPG